MDTWFKGDEAGLRAGKEMRLRTRQKLQQAREAAKKCAALAIASTKKRSREPKMTEGPREKETAQERRESKTKPEARDQSGRHAEHRKDNSSNNNDIDEKQRAKQKQTQRRKRKELKEHFGSR